MPGTLVGGGTRAGSVDGWAGGGPLVDVVGGAGVVVLVVWGRVSGSR